MKNMRAPVLMVLLAGLSAPVFAQDYGAPPQTAQTVPALAPQQLDQLLAPIALYPDQLVGQILMASTYPLEVVEAHRWLENPQNAALKDGALASAMEQQPWDPSVKSLVPFPQVLSMMDGNLQWTEQLGDAFIAQQTDVMDSVQRLRQMAQSSGHLTTTPQETVSTEDNVIVIQPAQPETVYIPYYNPTVVYGPWPYAGYQPYYFPPPPGYVYANRGYIGFSSGIFVISALWGWDHWDWHRHHIDIDDHRWRDLDEHHAPPAGNVWQHDPDHRHGVPYHTEAARTQFGGAAAQARFHDFRGFSAPQVNNRTVTPAAAGTTDTHDHDRDMHDFHHDTPAVGTTNTRPQRFEQRMSPPTQPTESARTPAPPPQQQQQRFEQHITPTAQPVPAPSPSQPQAPALQQHDEHIHTEQPRRPSPVFESFSRGQDVHMQSLRGASSMATMHPQIPQAQPVHVNNAPQTTRVPSNNGGGHGNDNHGDHGKDGDHGDHGHDPNGRGQ